MRIAIISDIHEDVAGLQRAMNKIDKSNCDILICLGDISGFSVPHYHHYDKRNAHECLKILINNDFNIILGNHDINACKRIPEISPEFKYPENWYELDYFQKKQKSEGKLWLYEEDELIPYYTKKDIEYLKQQPLFKIIDTDIGKLLFSHFAYPNICGCYSIFYHTADDYRFHFDFMKEKECAYGLIGHAHPEKNLIVTKDKVNYNGLKKSNIPENKTIVIIPSIAGNKRKNGFCIFDIDNNIIESKRI